MESLRRGESVEGLYKVHSMKGQVKAGPKTTT